MLQHNARAANSGGGYLPVRMMYLPSIETKSESVTHLLEGLVVVEVHLERRRVPGAGSTQLLKRDLAVLAGALVLGGKAEHSRGGQRHLTGGDIT